MTQFYFTRHGESQANVDEVFAGSAESPLTEKGMIGAENEGKRLALEKATYDLIITSPLSRAKDTALIIARAVGCPVENVVTEDLLIERGFGKLAGELWSSIPDESAETVVAAGGESIEDLEKRVSRALQKIRRLSSDKSSVLIVGHGTWYQMAETLLTNKKGSSFLEAANLPNNTVVQLHMENLEPYSM